MTSIASTQSNMTAVNSSPGFGIRAVDRAAVGLSPGPADIRQAVAVAPDGAHVYVTNRNSNTVSVIDTTTNTVVRNPITFGIAPQGVAVAPDGGHVYATNLISNTVSVIDTTINAVVTTSPVANEPVDVAVAPDGAHVYVANQGANRVSVIDTISNAVVIPASGDSQMW
jgi:YVTN family beta-propeller protein